MEALNIPETNRGRRRECAVTQNMNAETTDKKRRSIIDDKTTLRMSHKCAHFAPPLQNERKIKQHTQERMQNSKSEMQS
jgi:hypothetical protein